AVLLDLTAAACRLYRGDRAELALTEMKIDQGADIEVGDAIAVGQQEVATLDVLLDALDAGAGHGVEAGLGQGEVPVLNAGIMQGQRLRRVQVETDVGVNLSLIEEELLDAPAVVPKAEDDLLEAGAGVPFHDVPEDRPPADGDHRFGDVLGDIADARPLAATQDHHLHRLPPCLRAGRMPGVAHGERAVRSEGGASREWVLCLRAPAKGPCRRWTVQPDGR